ncbi:tyrosine-protein phosphatase [Mucilaginibacter lacusdianchii]|uniref:tyrosine-protein phosphatase n=1 Tax=Mucilaginibacter lacusdianchii TaxID=2684211 RepID=UPI00131D29F6|nr:CpsB/CapC family capsule biosynthesis tyrosine phosphatase [Mucilaginibacter sp. JXJ CY 39]
MFGLFRKNKKEPQVAVSLASVGVDMHSHILPGIDDGAKTVEDSVLLIRSLMDAGIKKIITTPHIMADYYKNTAETIGGALQQLKQHLAEIQLEVEIEAAAEHYFDEYFLELINTDRLMLINGKYVLFELSFTSRPFNVIPTIQQLTQKGLVPILAHPERYPYLSVQEVIDMRSWGCMIQMNILSACGYYGKEVKQSAERLIDAGVIDFISSDMHHARHAEALKQALAEPILINLINTGVLQNNLLLTT